MTTIQDRVLSLEGVANFRDFGGYPVAGGGRVRRGMLWRSGQHVGASDADLATIAGLGLSTVTDLRGGSERALNPCRRHPAFAAEVLACDGETAALASHIHVAAGVKTEDEARAAMRGLYAAIPYRETILTTLRRYFAALAERDGASLIHCFAGKDRTGVSVAFTHHILGVHPDDAMEDYLLTNHVMEGRIFAGRIDKDMFPTDPGALRALWGVRAEYLQSTYAAIRESHGTMDAYMADVVGLNSRQCDQIRERLTKA